MVEVINREKAYFRVEVKDVSKKPNLTRVISLTNPDGKTVEQVRDMIISRFNEGFA